MKLERMFCVVPGCSWRHTAVEDAEHWSPPVRAQLDSAFLAHVEVEHSANAPADSPWHDDALYREMCPTRPSTAFPDRMKLGPTAQFEALWGPLPMFGDEPPVVGAA